jgi:receptor expression-enhancing protein 5/6
MGLVVLALRSYLVFQNVFITFKTLKLPPPSSRNNGQPSIRALTQRKRDMKGCMAIWIVWVSRVPIRTLDYVMKGFAQVLPSSL